MTTKSHKLTLCFVHSKSLVIKQIVVLFFCFSSRMSKQFFSVLMFNTALWLFEYQRVCVHIIFFLSNTLAWKKTPTKQKTTTKRQKPKQPQNRTDKQNQKKTKKNTHQKNLSETPWKRSEAVNEFPLACTKATHWLSCSFIFLFPFWTNGVFGVWFQHVTYHALFTTRLSCVCFLFFSSKCFG